MLHFTFISLALGLTQLADLSGCSDTFDNIKCYEKDEVGLKYDQPGDLGLFNQPSGAINRSIYVVTCPKKIYKYPTIVLDQLLEMSCPFVTDAFTSSTKWIVNGTVASKWENKTRIYVNRSETGEYICKQLYFGSIWSYLEATTVIRQPRVPDHLKLVCAEKSYGKCQQLTIKSLGIRSDLPVFMDISHFNVCISTGGKGPAECHKMNLKGLEQRDRYNNYRETDFHQEAYQKKTHVVRDLGITGSGKSYKLPIGVTVQVFSNLGLASPQVGTILLS